MTTKTAPAMYVKQGRYIDFGFEPCANAFFDFYANPKYTETPLLDIQDVGFFLFLRKNANPKSPQWKMPSVRQMKQRLGIGQERLEGMLKRLEEAGLLEKESGVGQGENGENVANVYLLSDPLPTLTEFLYAFKDRLKLEWRAYLATLDSVPEAGAPPVSEIGTQGVPEIGTHKQTSFKQTECDDIWSSVLETLRGQLAQSTYQTFVEPTRLIGFKDGTATVELPNAKAKDWLENRLARQLRQLLTIETGKPVATVAIVVAGG